MVQFLVDSLLHIWPLPHRLIYLLGYPWPPDGGVCSLSATNYALLTLMNFVRTSFLSSSGITTRLLYSSKSLCTVSSDLVFQNGIREVSSGHLSGHCDLQFCITWAHVAFLACAFRYICSLSVVVGTLATTSLMKVSTSSCRESSVICSVRGALDNVSAV